MGEPLWAISSQWLEGRGLNRTEHDVPRALPHCLKQRKLVFTWVHKQAGGQTKSLDLGFTLRLSVVSFRPDWLCRASTRAVGRRFQRGSPCNIHGSPGRQSGTEFIDFPRLIIIPSLLNAHLSPPSTGSVLSHPRPLNWGIFSDPALVRRRIGTSRFQSRFGCAFKRQYGPPLSFYVDWVTVDC
jgi:hypothetical protein